MPQTGEKKVQLRVFDGVDLNKDARVINPDSFAQLKNLYAEVPGRIQKREGMDVLSDTAIWHDEQAQEVVDSIPLVSSRLFNTTGLNDLFGGSPGADIFATREARGITTLSKFRLNGIDDEVIVGAISFYLNTPGENQSDGLHDAPFYLDENDKMVIFPQTGIFSRGTHQWTFLQTPLTNTNGIFVVLPAALAGTAHDSVQRFLESLDQQKLFMGFATDEEGYLAYVTQRASGSRKMNTFAALIDSQTGAGQTWNMVSGVRDVIDYNGVVVLGGFRLHQMDSTDGISGPVTLKANEDEDNSHFIGFLEATDLQTMGPGQTLRIGRNAADPITALGLVTTGTDSQGFKAQLAVFTGTQYSIFDGVPPQATTVGSSGDFQNILNQNIGCNSKHSVVETPYGLVFLGNDGMFYLIRYGGVQPAFTIGEAIYPRTQKLSINQQKFVSAVYDQGYYKVTMPDPTGLDLTHSEEWWANLDLIGGSGPDRGIKWYGPMVRQAQASSFVQIEGRQANIRLLVGGSTDPRIFESARGSSRDDFGTDISVVMESNLIDGGDPQVIKDFARFEFGAGSNGSTTVTSTMAVSSNTVDVAESDVFSNTVTNVGAVFGTAVVFGPDVVFGPGDSGFKQFPNRPTKRLRGGSVKFTLTEASDKKLDISDVTIGFREINRRG